MSEQTTPQNKPENAGGVMAGKRGLIMGVANDRSIAWGIAAKLAEQGAELAFTFQGEALEKRVRPLAAEVGATLVAPCDVTDDDSIRTTHTHIIARVFSRDPRRRNRRR